ncbi:50S ribosomal protein L11 methyltransferase [candidate division KSB1 bacterium]|nr:50S ribosomal protein L11 methyltransferase [candidate division KSB1 bacterium]
MSWVELIVPTRPEYQEGVTNFLFDAQAQGCVEQDGAILAYFAAPVFSESLITQLNQYLTALKQLGFDTTMAPVKINKIADQDWNAVWRSQFKPVKITDRFVVKPGWVDYQPLPTESVIEIDPKMAFGTGTHETTQLMIESMELCTVFQKRVLDVGTGTGILAMVAQRLGAASIYALDTDPDAIGCAAENLESNHCQDSIQLGVGSLEWIKPKNLQFDLILVNIQKSIILAMQHDLVALLAREGRLILSGILTEQAAEIQQAFEAMQLICISGRQKGEWMSFIFQKTAAGG